MKVLMFGWEFPPHILGGLGTASYGIIKGLASQNDMEITLCLPKPWGDEDRSFLNIIPMNNVPVVWRDVHRDYLEQRLAGRMSADLYYDLRNHIYADFNYRYTDDLGCIEFSGRYPDNLMEEINNYSIVAELRHNTCTRLAHLPGRDTCQASIGETSCNTRSRHRFRPKQRTRKPYRLQH